MFKSRLATKISYLYLQINLNSIFNINKHCYLITSKSDAKLCFSETSCITFVCIEYKCIISTFPCFSRLLHFGNSVLVLCFSSQPELYCLFIYCKNIYLKGDVLNSSFVYMKATVLCTLFSCSLMIMIIPRYIHKLCLFRYGCYYYYAVKEYTMVCMSQVASI